MAQTSALLPGGGHAYRFDPAPFISDDALALGLAERPRLLSDADILAATTRIGEAYRAMKRDQAGLPEGWLPVGEWRNYLAEKSSLCGLLAAGDYHQAAELFANFWRDAEIGPIVKEYATFVALSDGVADQKQRFEHNLVRNWLIWRELTGCPTAELATPNIGSVWGYGIEGIAVAPKACRYHLLARELSGMLAGLASPVVAEIGGGYGGLAEFFLRNNANARWIDYDLPETAVMAAFFLIGARGDEHVTLYGETGPLRDPAGLPLGQAVILPNYALRDLGAGTIDAFTNMFSLSEVGHEPLGAYLARINATTRGWFVHHNMDRAGVINRGHERIPSSTFAPHLPDLPLVATGFDPFHGPDGDYRWFIHRRREVRP
jgi:putative sugar O-methyltransferase